MATFLPGITDTNLDPVLFTPDYSFLRYNLQKKSAQYEQGLKSVSSAYGALKKEMSDPVNVERRDSYLKAAESELQKIASADLSLQQNVNAANAIFDPIATDPAIAYDSYHTGRIKKEMAQMESWAASDDMETRKKFNAQVYNWLKRDLDSLKNGNGDINNYKVQGRKAWAYVDPLEIVNKMAKDMGFKVENDELGHPYVITTIDGKTNRESYEQFAQTVLQSNPVYQQQKAILSEAQVEDDYERAMADPKNAGLTREQVFATYSSQKYDRDKERETEYLKALDDRLNTKTAQYKAFLNQNSAEIDANPQGEKAQMASQMGQSLLQYKSNLDKKAADFQNLYGTDETSAEKKKQFLKKFVENPKAYYASQIEAEDVVKFANLRSSFGTRSIKADQGYLGMLTAANRSLNTLINAADKQFDNEMDIAELGLKEAALALKGKAKDGSTKKNADGTDKQADVELIGTSSTQVNVTQKLNQLQERFEMNKAKAKASLTSTYGALYLLEKMGVNSSDVSLVRGYISRSFDDPNTKVSKEEGDALNRAYATMFTWAKSSSNPDKELVDILRAQAQPGKTVKDLDFTTYLKMAAKTYVPKEQSEYQAMRNIANYENSMAQVDRLNKVINKGVEVVVEQIKNDKSFANLLVEDKGKKRLVNADDIYKSLPSKGWKEDINWSIDPQVTLSDSEKRDIANGIFEGRISVKHRGKMMSGGDNPGKMFTTDGTFIEYGGRTLYLTNNFSAIPFTSEELQKGLKKVNERVPIPMLESDQAGVMVTGSSAFIIRNQAKEDIRVKLTTPTQENSNILMSDGSGRLDGYTDASPAEQEMVRNAMASKENVEQVMLYTNSPLNGGSQLVEVVMKTISGDKGPAWSGKRYFFPINVNQSSNETFRVFAQTDELDEFMAYSKENKPYKIDYFEGSGVKAEMIADQPGAQTGRVILKTKYDPVTKRYTDNWITNEIPFDLTKVTFTEVKEEIFNNFITPYMQGYMNNNKQAMNSVGAPGSTLRQRLQNLVTW